jgi:legume-like lectin family protein
MRPSLLYVKRYRSHGDYPLELSSIQLDRQFSRDEVTLSTKRDWYKPARIEGRFIMVGISRLMKVAAIAALVVSGVMPVLAQSPNFPNFSSIANLTLNGNAAQSGNVLRLTPNTTDQAGSAWFNTQQPVGAAFSTTFTFQLSGANTMQNGCVPDQFGFCPADGIAFVIQNSALTALGPDGCGIGFGDSSTGCAPSTGGITNSLAVEFDIFQNADDPSNNHVSVQSCLTSSNSRDPGICRIADNPNVQPINMSDGNPHSVTITYAPPATGSGPGTLDVILDNTDLFPPTVSNPSGGVAFDMTSISLNSGNAWVGFTAATGGADDNQDILSWVFTPGTQTALVTTGMQSILNFQNAAQNNVYDYAAQLTSGSPVAVQVNPILMTQSACDALVQKSFWPARCFVYENAENMGVDAAVMFEVTCPQSQGGTCGSSNNQDFFAELGTDFEFLKSENPLFTYPGIFGLFNPFPGWLQGDLGPDPLHPCTPPATGPLFQSNQIDTFFIDGGTTRGKGNGGASCWVATYDTPGEAPPGIKISSPTFTSYKKGQVVAAAYTCNNPFTSKPSNNPTGPYLTAASCIQSSGVENLPCTQTGNGLACTGTVDTSTRGLHTFAVTGIDSGGNVNINAVIYNVK